MQNLFIKENQGPAINPQLKTTNDFLALTEVDHRARHMAQSDLDQCLLNQHSDRWNKVDTQAKRILPEDDDQPPLKQIVAIHIGKGCRFALRKTEEDGVFTMTGEQPKWEYPRTSKASLEEHGSLIHWNAR